MEEVQEPDEGSTITKFTTHNNDISSVEFSPVDNKIVSGSREGTAKVWEAETGNIITDFSDYK